MKKSVNMLTVVLAIAAMCGCGLEKSNYSTIENVPAIPTETLLPGVTGKPIKKVTARPPAKRPHHYEELALGRTAALINGAANETPAESTVSENTVDETAPVSDPTVAEQPVVPASWQNELGTRLTKIRQIADQNNDGRKDYLVGGIGNILWCLDGATGAVLWQIEFTDYCNGACMTTDLDVGDLNGDGVEDFLVGRYGHRAYAIDGRTHNVMWRQQFPVEDGRNRFPNTFVRFYRDPSSASSKVLMVSAEIFAISWLDGANGNLISTGPTYEHNAYEFTQDPDNNDHIKGVEIVPDLNGDGRPEVFYYSSRGQMGMIAGISGTALWETDFPFYLTVAAYDPYRNEVVFANSVHSSFSSIIAIDAAAGPMVEKWEINQVGYVTGLIPSSQGIFAHQSIYRIENGQAFLAKEVIALRNGNIAWTYLSTDMVTRLVSHDFNGDGVDDVAFGGWSGSVWGLDGGTGALLWTHDTSDSEEDELHDVMDLGVDVSGALFGVTYGKVAFATQPQ